MVRLDGIRIDDRIIVSVGVPYIRGIPTHPWIQFLSLFWADRVVDGFSRTLVMEVKLTSPSWVRWLESINLLCYGVILFLSSPEHLRF